VICGVRAKRSSVLPLDPEFRLAVARVANRVAQGGHNVPEATIRRRYAAGLRNFFTIYRPLFDSWHLYNGAELPPMRIARGSGGRLEAIQPELYEKLRREGEH
jgi:predicted ABC-type ATPase